jgi:recombination protein RecA
MKPKLKKKNLENGAGAKASASTVLPKMDGDDFADFLATQVKKKFGDESMMKLSGGSLKVQAAFSSGIPDLDNLIGIGGFPKGRIVEIIGPESSGKTTICLHAAAVCQKVGGTVAFIDAENALDVNYAQDLGVNVQKMLISQPDDGEMAFGIMETLLEASKSLPKDKPLLVIVDSTAALIPRSELEGEEVGDGRLGAHASLMSKGLKRLVSMTRNINCVFIFTNQIRSKIGVKFGSPETTPGGNAMKFYASLRLDIRNIGKDKSGDDVTGYEARIKSIKNKVAPPFKEIIVKIRFGIGVDLIYGKYDALLTGGYIIKKAGWNAIRGVEKQVAGYKGFVDFYKANPDVIENLLKEANAAEKNVG